MAAWPGGGWRRGVMQLERPTCRRNTSDDQPTRLDRHVQVQAGRAAQQRVLVGSGSRLSLSSTVWTCMYLEHVQSRGRRLCHIRCEVRRPTALDFGSVRSFSPRVASGCPSACMRASRRLHGVSRLCSQATGALNTAEPLDGIGGPVSHPSEPSAGPRGASERGFAWRATNRNFWTRRLLSKLHRAIIKTSTTPSIPRSFHPPSLVVCIIL